MLLREGGKEKGTRVSVTQDEESSSWSSKGVNGWPPVTWLVRTKLGLYGGQVFSKLDALLEAVWYSKSLRSFWNSKLIERPFGHCSSRHELVVEP